MAKDPTSAPPRTSRRTRFSLLLPVLLVGAWYGGQALVRGHVDGLIQGRVGVELPAFSLQDRGGRTWTAQDVKGKPLLLHFFRSKCHSCEAEAADYRRAEAELQGARSAILHVCTDPVLEFDPQLTAATIAQKQFAAPILMATAAFVDAFHRASWSNVTPVTYVVDASGRIRAALRGGQTFAQLEAALAAVQ